MKKLIKRSLTHLSSSLDRKSKLDSDRYNSLFTKYQDFTMMPKDLYIDTIAFVEKLKHLEGNVVECGVWRGGMIAGMADVLGNERKYFLCDSFEGLPPATDIDGKSAIDWQADTSGATYYNNCSAEEEFADNAMKIANVNYQLVKGWFNKTLSTLETGPIAFLRLDADWFDSMYCCMENLYPRVIKNGIILIDDYFVWEGCSKAIHAYLANTSSASRIYHTPKGITYIIKND